MKIRILTPLFAFSIAAAALGAPSEQGINAEPVPGQAHRYSLSIRFDAVDRVELIPLLSAAKAGAKRERISIPASQWHFDRTTNTITVDRDVDTAAHMVSASGRYALPLRIVPAAPTDPASIRLIVSGRIGKEGTDYRYDKIKEEIVLTSCVEGSESYIVQFKQGEGIASVGSIAGLKREHRRHLSWPLDGNTTRLDASGKRFSPEEGTFRTVSMIELLPAKDGYDGKVLTEGFTWNSSKNELVLDEPVDERFSVFVISGE